MQPLEQTEFKRPDPKHLRASLASILEWELWDLPDFTRFDQGSRRYGSALEFLLVYVDRTFESSGTFVAIEKAREGIALASGHSGVLHGGVLRDPSPGGIPGGFRPTHCLVFDPPLTPRPRPFVPHRCAIA